MGEGGQGARAQVSPTNLERVRKVKTRHQRLLARATTMREELERFLEDDDDMAKMCLTRRLEARPPPPTPPHEGEGHQPARTLRVHPREQPRLRKTLPAMLMAFSVPQQAETQQQMGAMPSSVSGGLDGSGGGGTPPSSSVPGGLSRGSLPRSSSLAQHRRMSLSARPGHQPSSPRGGEGDGGALPPPTGPRLTAGASHGPHPLTLAPCRQHAPLPPEAATSRPYCAFLQAAAASLSGRKAQAQQLYNVQLSLMMQWHKTCE